jgi:hypothetical protein
MTYSEDFRSVRLWDPIKYKHFTLEQRVKTGE